MQKVQLYGPKYAIKDRSIRLNCSSDTVPEGNTAELLMNGTSVNNVRLHQKRCFRTVDVIECVPGVCQCSADGRVFVFYLTPNETGKYRFSCRMKFFSNVSTHGHFETHKIVTNVIDPTPLIKTEKHGYLISLTYSVGFIDIITVLKWSCDNEAIMSESLHNASTSWSVVRLDISKKKSTTLCVCNVSLLLLNFTGSAATQLKYRGRPELLQNEVVYLRNGVVFSLTFYSSEESNIITWYRQWIRLVNSTEQVQTTKQTTLNVLVRGQTVSVEGYKSSLVLRNAKENHLYNIKICVKNYYGISCHRYLASEEKEMKQTKPIIWVIAVVTVIVCGVGFALLFYRQRSEASKITKEKHALWKNGGAPKDKNNPLKSQLTTAKRLLRKAHRQAYASQREKLANQIMTASSSDNKLFHKLLRTQRSDGNRFTKDATKR
ncbi:unnamed protein product [Mytilus coruscus]|uniref:Uncharacterized protein n=1 Tax=Mytilus coruscus TaxID=42192 RepID=A0A6J8DQ88_MYTCO|nr:unnamed protein product [Mytilus coruscus]